MPRTTCKMLISTLVASAFLMGPLQARSPRKLTPFDQCLATTIGSCQQDFEEGTDARKNCIKAAEKFCWETVGDKNANRSEWTKPSNLGSGQVVKRDARAAGNGLRIIKRNTLHNLKN